jgi:hypothetical protein
VWDGVYYVHVKTKCCENKAKQIVVKQAA